MCVCVCVFECVREREGRKEGEHEDDVATMSYLTSLMYAHIVQCPEFPWKH